jgi:hypothetical protein
MALLLLFGVILIIDLLLRSIDITRVPGFLGDILKIVAVGIASAANAISVFLASIARGALSVFTAPAMALVTSLNATVFAFARLGSWVKWLVRTEVPTLWSGLIATVANAVNNLVALANRLYAQAIAYATALSTMLRQLIAAGIATATAYALSLYRSAISALNAAIAVTTAYALSLYRNAIAALVSTTANVMAYILAVRNQLANYALGLAQWAVATAIGASNDWAKRYADHLIDLYNRALAGAGALAMAPAWPHILDAIDSISLALPDSIAAVLARIGAIPRAIPRDLALEIGAATAVGAIAIDWVARCGVSLCRNTKGFGDELAALEDAALIAAIFEMVVEGVANPEGAGKAVHDDMVGPLSTIGREFSNLVGLKG